MKGIVFTEFLDLVDDAFGQDVSEEILDAAAPESGGAYTAVGTYDFSELAGLVAALSRTTGTPIGELLRTYGRHLFGRLATGYPTLLEGIRSPFELLESVDGVIHVEVRKLYPDAELPHFESTRSEGGALILTYRSRRPLGDLAFGLIEGCLAHFGVSADLRSAPIEGEDGVDGVTAWRFTILPEPGDGH